jgi:hypothetical protein
MVALANLESFLPTILAATTRVLGTSWMNLAN